MILYWFLAFSVRYSEAEVYKTMNDTDLSIARFCMENKHPFIPSTFSCENHHQGHISSLLSTINQMLKKVDTSYSPSNSLYPSFPGISTGILSLQSSFPLNQYHYAKYAMFNTFVGSEIGNWMPFTSNINQYLYIGSSVPYVFDKIITAGSGSSGFWVTSYHLSYSLDNRWINYGVITSNTDDNSLHEFILIPFIAKAIMLNPLTWNGAIAMRVEVYVSKHDYKAVVEKQQYFPSISYGFHFSFSNIKNDAAGYDVIKPGSKKEGASYYEYFCLNKGEYIIVSSGHLMSWYKVTFLNADASSQGIEYFKIKYTQDGDTWIDYLGGQALTLSVGVIDYFIEGTFNAISVKFIFFQSTLALCCFQLEVYVGEA